MEKISTFSVVAYNMEKYIRQTLDSLIVPNILDKLEVFVVDDGGTDSTLAIAKEYESHYLNTFHALHKENGGYGSTINYSVARATGKYFEQWDVYSSLDTSEINKRKFIMGRLRREATRQLHYYCSLPAPVRYRGEMLKFQNKLRTVSPEVITGAKKHSKMVWLMFNTQHIAYPFAKIIEYRKMKAEGEVQLSEYSTVYALEIIPLYAKQTLGIILIDNWIPSPLSERSVA